MTELQEIRQKFLRQAQTFRCLAKMLSKCVKKEMETKICEGMAEVADDLAEIVTKEMGKS